MASQPVVQPDDGALGIAAPLVTVVIPTRNRAASLQRTLLALEAQTFPPTAFEVVVVADGCTDETVERLRGYAAPYALRVLEQPSCGAAAARNRGAAAARGLLLVFLDDDVEPAPALLEAHVKAHANGAARVVLGPYPPALQHRTDFLGVLLRNWYNEQFGARACPDHRFTYRDLFGGNLSLGAELFEQVGGFDSAIGGCGGEDWELGIRLLEAETSFHFASEAVARHHEHETTNLDRFFARANQEGRVDVHIGCRHPQMKPVLRLAKGKRRHPTLHRMVRALAKRWPTAGDRLATRLRRFMDLLERARLRRQWRVVCGGLHSYWYWRGVLEELKTRQLTLQTFLSDGAALQGRAPGVHSADTAAAAK